MPLDATTLLAGPRGRRVALEYARLCAERARGAAQPTADQLADPSDAWSALWWAAIRLDPDTRALLTTSSVGRYHPGPDDGPIVTPADAAAALDRVDLAAHTADDLRDMLAVSVDVARYWQEPDADDILVGTDEIRHSLTRFAQAIAAAPQAQWWSTGVDAADQWTVGWSPSVGATDVATMLREWRSAVADEESAAGRDRPADPAASSSGEWWSIPFLPLVTTTRSLPGWGPAGLWFEEDSLGPQTAVALPVDVFATRVIEIDAPEDWVDLCRRHPIDVTASRRHDWFRATGRAGRWVIPDWSRVAQEADAVHLTVRGYLSAAGVAVPVADDTASVIAGWNPDQTYWFRGAAVRHSDQQRWARDDDGIWHRR
ncbi:hypothetical protein ACFUTX_09635 [Microbacterium sp. NPDC057407]|uniref:hypothetical protein n=1 Tax=Microbacterium sp. NPDC057407 TaxID=3346120 RepID=UPI00366F699A